ncbi:MAG: hypothetical protein Q7R84_01835 [bacterium]|nr:hypothetical protein [bacterium]
MDKITVFIEEKSRKTLQVVRGEILPVIKGQTVFLGNATEIQRTGVFVACDPELFIFEEKNLVQLTVPLTRIQ